MLKSLFTVQCSLSSTEIAMRINTTYFHRQDELTCLDSQNVRAFISGACEASRDLASAGPDLRPARHTLWSYAIVLAG